MRTPVTILCLVVAIANGGACDGGEDGPVEPGSRAHGTGISAHAGAGAALPRPPDPVLATPIDAQKLADLLPERIGGWRLVENFPNHKPLGAIEASFTLASYESLASAKRMTVVIFDGGGHPEASRAFEIARANKLSTPLVRYGKLDVHGAPAVAIVCNAPKSAQAMALIAGRILVQIDGDGQEVEVVLELLRGLPFDLFEDLIG
jgi:hypothetical protein